jgi:transcription antitermination protein NusB
VRERSRARSWTLQVLYAWEARGRVESPIETFAAFQEGRRISVASRPYLRELLKIVGENHNFIDEMLERSLTNWRLDRLSVIDRNILRIGAAELLKLPDVPSRVAIREAILLAEKYGTNESPRFVNGVLDALMRQARGEPDAEESRR